MLKKGNETPSSARIRENQRRCRTRRKELIEDLQQRVRDFELKGVAATQDMQRAARRVMQENVRLRSMLAQHGVTPDEVESFLRPFEEGNPSKDTPGDVFVTPAPRQPGMSETTSSPGLVAKQPPSHTQRDGGNVSGINAYVQISGNKQADATDTTHETITLEPRGQACIPSQAACCSGSRNYDNIQHDHQRNNTNITQSFSEAPECPNTSECFCAPTSTAKIQPPNLGLEISCETAATIIIEMRGDGDMDAVRASLGCTGHEECSVRNSTVLQIMDER